MRVFNYKAKNLQGEVIKGQQEAKNIDEIKNMMMKKGYFLVEIHQKGKELSLNKSKKVKLKDFVMFCNQLSILLSSGVTIIDSISVLIHQTSSKVLVVVLEEVYEGLLKGVQFSDALAVYPDIFPDFFMNMIKVGEATGSMDEVLLKLSEYYENENKIKRKIKSASMYPKLVLCAALGVISLLMIKVLPMFSDILSEMGGELPGITLLLMGVSNFMVNNFLLLAGLIVIIVVLFSGFSKTVKGRYILDGVKMSFPLVGNLTKKSVTAKFSRSMGLLLQSGIPIINAMDIMSILIDNVIIQGRFEACCGEVKSGRTISGSLKNMDVFPPLLIHMVNTGEKTGKLDEMLTRTAKFFDEEVEQSVNQLITLIEPILIIFLAVIIGVILLSVMLPMMSVMEQMQ